MVVCDGKEKILLVDDNEIQRSVIKIQLENDYDVATATSGREAVERLVQGFVPDLILLDILMPDMDGWETFGRIRAVSLLHQIPIVFLSALNDNKEIDRAYKMGASDFITKPYNDLDFQNRIKKVLGKIA